MALSRIANEPFLVASVGVSVETRPGADASHGPRRLRRATRTGALASASVLRPPGPRARSSELGSRTSVLGRCFGGDTAHSHRL